MSRRLGTLLPRAVVLAGPVLALGATGVSGPWPRIWLVALTVVLATGFAAMPESPLGTAALVVVVLWWAIASRHGSPAMAVVAALLLLASHVSALLLAYGPAGLPMDPRVLRRWLRRAALVGASAPLVWLLAVAVEEQPEPPGIWVAGLAAAVTVSVVAAAAVAVRGSEA